MKIRQKILLSLGLLVLAGCTTTQSRITHEQEQVLGVGYLGGKYRVCGANCPVPTPKEIDDTVPMNVLVSEMVKKSISMPAPTPVAEMEKQDEKKESAEPAPIVQQHEIYFDFAMSHPNAEGESELRRFKESIRGLNNMKIELVGRTDAIGSMEFNRRLAMKRAKHIAARIKALDIKAQVTLSAKAACCHPVPHDRNDQAFKKDRRVTINYRRATEGQ